MKKMFIIAIMVAASAGWSTIGLHGQASEAGPSLDETVTYMKSFLDQHGCTTIEGATGYSTVVWCNRIASSDRCILQLSGTRTITVNSDGSRRVTNLPPFKVDLSTLDPTGVKTGPDVSMPGDSSYDAGLAVLAQPSSVGNGLKLPVDDAEMAKHLINALSHAITLCGGKKAAF
jgi:hypothetical protein